MVLNPVRARMVRSAKDWPWSSYRATATMADGILWLHTGWILSAFSSRKGRAIERYREFVAQGKNQPSPWEQLKNPVFLGDDTFVEKMQAKLDGGKDLREIPARQRRPLAKPLHHYAANATTRDEAITAAYASGGYSMKEIGDHFGLHYSYVSKIISRATEEKGKT